MIRLELLVVGELDVDSAPSQLSQTVGEVSNHRAGRALVAHLQEGLVLPLEHQHVGNAPEGDPQVDDLRLGHVIRNVADVDDARWLAHVRLQLHLKQNWFVEQSFQIAACFMQSSTGRKRADWESGQNKSPFSIWPGAFRPELIHRSENSRAQPGKLGSNLSYTIRT